MPRFSEVVMPRFALAALVATACALAPLAAEAQKVESVSYRCVGKDRKTYYGERGGGQWGGKRIELLNSQGVVVKRIDPQADAEKKQLKEAEDAKKRQEDAALKERLRREKALLASYSSESDIEASRKRALLGNEKAIQEIDARMEGIKKRQAELAKELEFYKGKNKPPVKLDQEAKNNETDLKAQEGLRELKKKDVDAINAKYDEDKRRYIELTRGSAKK